MIEHRMTLDYTLATGWMAPFVEGLLAGRAVARQCASCDRTSFPPLRVCICGDTEGGWKPLGGEARITLRTEGHDGVFGLVRFDGADTQSVVRLDGITAEQRRGRIAVPDGPLPMMILQPIEAGTAA